jgi:AraC-like DNA-binding protein
MSRFLHLFRQETGSPFRPFRAWKRARRLLDQVSAKCSLTDMALDSGYSDSSHFSNSIRDSFGVKPRDMLAGFRHMPTFKRCNAPASAASLSR